jgi:hypothetical protein
MPNIRARRQPVGVDSRTLVARPLLAIGALTKNAAGLPLTQALVRGFKTVTDVLVSRDISSPTGQYTLSVPDTSPCYAVAIQDGTIDSGVVTIDNNAVTIDRMTSVGGVSANSLVGGS